MSTTPANPPGETARKPAKNAPPAPPAAPPRRGFPWGLILVLVAAVVLGLAVFLGIRSRLRAESRLQETARDGAAPYVAVTHPAPGAASSEIALPGNTQAFISTPIFARTSGYLKAWYADIGTPVKQGDLLAVIETPELDQQLDQAQADLRTAQANLQIAQATNQRYQGLLASNSVSHQETDTAAADFLAKQAAVNSAEANVRRLQQLQAYEKIYAPFDGVITARDTDIGALIQTGDTRPLFHLAAIDRLRIYVSVPEVYAAQVADGEKAALTVDALPGETFTGTVTRNAAAIDPVTRTLNVEVDVDNPAGRILPGAYVFVHFKFPAAAGSVTVPSSALLFRTEGPRVGVVRDGKARLVPVAIGHDYGTSLEIVSGLGPDDQVILDPSDSLADGAPVQVAPSKPAAAP